MRWTVSPRPSEPQKAAETALPEDRLAQRADLGAAMDAGLAVDAFRRRRRPPGSPVGASRAFDPGRDTPSATGIEAISFEFEKSFGLSALLAAHRNGAVNRAGITLSRNAKKSGRSRILRTLSPGRVAEWKSAPASFGNVR